MNQCFKSPKELSEWQSRNCMRCKKCVVFNERLKRMPIYKCAIQRDIEGEQKGKPATSRSYEMTRNPECPMLRAKENAPAPSNSCNIERKYNPEPPAKANITVDAAPAYIPVRRKEPTPMYVAPRFRTPLLLTAVKKMTERQDEQRENVYNNVDCEASRIANNVTFATICRNELANETVRKAVSAARSCKPIYKFELKKHVNEVSTRVAKYDALIASVAQGNAGLLDYADGYTDYFIKKSMHLYDKVYAAILNAMLPHRCQYAEMVARFEAASILTQFASERLDIEIERFKLQSVNVLSLGYLSLRNINAGVDFVLADINKKVFLSDGVLSLNDDPGVVKAVHNLINYISHYQNVQDAIHEYDSILLQQYKESKGL